MYDGRQLSAAHHTLADSLQAPNASKRFGKETTQLCNRRILGISRWPCVVDIDIWARGAEMQKYYG